jgi:hypothetical protein
LGGGRFPTLKKRRNSEKRSTMSQADVVGDNAQEEDEINEMTFLNGFLAACLNVERGIFFRIFFTICKNLYDVISLSREITRKILLQASKTFLA